MYCSVQEDQPAACEQVMKKAELSLLLMHVPEEWQIIVINWKRGGSDWIEERKLYNKDN